MALWFRDADKVVRLRKHIDWFYRHNEIHQPVRFPHRNVIRPVGPDSYKTLIKDVKYLEGYLLPYRTWASGTYPKLIDVIHHPSMVGRAAQKRGVERRIARRRPPHPTTRSALAKAIVESRFASFPGNFTGGSAEAGLRAAAAGLKSHVYVTGGNVYIDTRILAFIYDLLQHGGTVSINCVVNGRHSSGSQHYRGQAVDIDKNATSRVALNVIYAVAARHGLVVLNEDAFHYHVHTP